MEMFCYIINVFIITFDQFNASLLNKAINEKKHIIKSNTVQ